MKTQKSDINFSMSFEINLIITVVVVIKSVGLNVTENQTITYLRNFRVRCFSHELIVFRTVRYLSNESADADADADADDSHSRPKRKKQILLP